MYLEQSQFEIFLDIGEAYNKVLEEESNIHDFYEICVKKYEIQPHQIEKLYNGYTLLSDFGLRFLKKFYSKFTFNSLYAFYLFEKQTYLDAFLLQKCVGEKTIFSDDIFRFIKDKENVLSELLISELIGIPCNVEELDVISIKE